jgi:hypothetical protein
MRRRGNLQRQQTPIFTAKRHGSSGVTDGDHPRRR